VFFLSADALVPTDINGQYDVYDARGVYVGSDPDQNIRFDLQRDGGVRGSN